MHVVIKQYMLKNLRQDRIIQYRISTSLYTRNLYSYSHFEILICIYSVRSEIDQISTNTFRYTICSAPNVYIFVYILIETRIAPLYCLVQV